MLKEFFKEQILSMTAAILKLLPQQFLNFLVQPIAF